MTPPLEAPVIAPAPPVAVVALAASAGGLAALSQILSRLPADFPAPVVVVQHLDPRHRSLMASILDRRCPLRVKEARHGDALEPGTVYIAPPDYHLLVNADNTLALTRSAPVHFVRPSADLLFASAAAAFAERAVAVVLTGTGCDGGGGVRAVKRAGGTVIAQDKATSEFFGMPATAIETGSVDLILPLSEVAPALVTLTKQVRILVTSEKDPKFEALLEYLQRTRGFDFSAYKRASMMRRVAKRIQLIKNGDFENYMDYLEVHPEEFAHLFDTILINVTSFFRDKPAWDHLAREILPQLLGAKQPDAPVRVWSAGCASGEEAYTLAMLLAEALGEEDFQRRVKIYASDVDEQALAQARAASYSPAQLEEVPEALTGKYFTTNGERCVFRPDLRRAIIFGRHDLVQDAPISRLDLLVCRNSLMYLNAETQAKILARFHFALNDSGFLFLGKAEMLLTHANLFVPVDLRSRIFAKAARTSPRDRLLLMAQGGETEAVNQLSRHVRLREEAFIASPMAQMVVDPNGAVVLINDRMRSLFNLDSRDVGRPLQDLEISYRPLELRSLVDQARLDRRAVTVPNIERRPASGEPQFFDVVIVPLMHNGEGPLGITIAFNDVTRNHQLQSDLQRSNQELETANEELQSAHEELETTNEELQSTNEELETTNEELQSTNEELETMNEELQSTNEELETINAELRDRTAALDSANLFLHAILTSLRTGVVVVDRQLNVMIWNYRAEDLWGLRFDEVLGKSLLSLDIGLAVRQLEEPIRRLLHGESKDGEVVLDAHDRRGRPLRCRISCTPLGSDRDGGVPGVVLLMSDLDQPNAEPGSGNGQGSGS